jgi:hypothetical protein
MCGTTAEGILAGASTGSGLLFLLRKSLRTSSIASAAKVLLASSLLSRSDTIASISAFGDSAYGAANRCTERRSAALNLPGETSLAEGMPTGNVKLPTSTLSAGAARVRVTTGPAPPDMPTGSGRVPPTPLSDAATSGEPVLEVAGALPVATKEPLDMATGAIPATLREGWGVLAVVGTTPSNELALAELYIAESRALDIRLTGTDTDTGLALRHGTRIELILTASIGGAPGGRL